MKAPKLLRTVKDKFRRPFVRNVVTIAGGTALSQAIAMAFAPLITRLYGPEAYGLQGVFTSVVSLFSTVAALGYPTAILLPRDDREAWAVVRLSLSIGFATAVAMLAALLLFAPFFLQILQVESLGGLILLVPLAMFLGLIGGVLNHWLTRKQAFKVMAQYGVITTFLTSGAKSALGLVSPAAVTLIVVNTLGQIIGPAAAYKRWRKDERAVVGNTFEQSGEWLSLLRMAKRYADFPLLRTPQNLINAVSQSLPILLLSGFYGSGAAGHYSIALSVLGVAPALIGGAVMSVFYPRINLAINEGEDARALIIRATLGMAVVGALPFLVVVLAGPMLFSFVFGAEWGVAGRYAQWLAPWLFLQYINKPAVAAIPALRLQGGLLVYELFSTGSKIIALYIGFKVLKDDVSTVALFSVAGIFAYLWLILWVVHKSAQPIVQRA